MVDITLGVAFVAGLLSFLSPCIFPLVPGFLAYLAGLDLADAKATRGFNRRIFINTAWYVLGFTLVFSVLGLVLASVFGTLPIGSRTWLSRIGGVIILLFGLSMLGVIRVPFLDREHRPHVKRRAGYVTSFLLGMAFAIGWTPCFGAVLGGILTLAAITPSDAFVLLLAYALGLSVPFILVGVSYASVSRFVARTARYTPLVTKALGILLVVVGLLILLNQTGSFGFQGLFDSWYADRERELLELSSGANLA